MILNIHFVHTETNSMSPFNYTGHRTIKTHNCKMATQAITHKLSKIQSQLKHVQSSWPLDPLRINQPDLEFSSAISKAIDRVFTPGYASTQSGQVEGCQRMLSSLENLSDGSIARKFPFPQSMRNPDSFPRHYEELNEGVQRAIRGESLPWYRRWIRFT